MESPGKEKALPTSMCKRLRVRDRLDMKGNPSSEWLEGRMQTGEPEDEAEEFEQLYRKDNGKPQNNLKILKDHSVDNNLEKRWIQNQLSVLS